MARQYRADRDSYYGAHTMELKKGTSVIELTVVIGLISLLALAISAIMLTTTLSSNRLRRAAQLKQAGDFALTQIQTLIRNSRDVITCDPDTDSLTLINPDSGTTDIMVELDGGSSRIASNSGIYLTPNTQNVSNFSLSCEPTTIAPTLFKIAFDLSHTNTSGNDRENTSLHFETTTTLRNE